MIQNYFANETKKVEDFKAEATSCSSKFLAIDSQIKARA